MKNLFLLFIATLMLSSCKQEKKELTSTSPNGSIKITVTGTRENMLAPWLTNTVAEGSGLLGNVQFEYYGSDISDKTIQFAWEGDEKCTITFTEKDDKKRIWEFTPEGKNVMWKDLSPK